MTNVYIINNVHMENKVVTWEQLIPGVEDEHNALIKCIYNV